MINEKNLIKGLVEDSVSSISLETIKKSVQQQLVCTYKANSSFDDFETEFIYVIAAARKLRKMNGSSRESIVENVTFANLKVFIEQAITYHSFKILHHLTSFGLDDKFEEFNSFNPISHLNKEKYQVGDVISFTINPKHPDFKSQVKILELSSDSVTAVIVNPEGPYDARLEDELKFELNDEYLLGLQK